MREIKVLNKNNSTSIIVFYYFHIVVMFNSLFKFYDPQIVLFYIVVVVWKNVTDIWTNDNVTRGLNYSSPSDNPRHLQLPPVPL